MAEYKIPKLSRNRYNYVKDAPDAEIYVQRKDIVMQSSGGGNSSGGGSHSIEPSVAHKMIADRANDVVYITTDDVSVTLPATAENGKVVYVINQTQNAVPLQSEATILQTRSSESNQVVTQCLFYNGQWYVL